MERRDQTDIYRLTTPVKHPSTSRDHYPDQPYQKPLLTSTSKGNGAWLLPETTFYFLTTTSTHTCWFFPLLVTWDILQLLTLYSATAPSTLVHNCFTNCTPSTPWSTVPCTHWYSAYSQEKTRPTTYVSSATSKTYPDIRTSTTTDSIHRLRDFHKQRSHYRFPRGDHQGVFLPLHTMHLAEDSKVWTTDLIQRKRWHYQTGSTSSCIAPCTTEQSRRRLVQRPTRHWRRRQCSWHNHIYRLRHRALGWDTHISLEPLLDRGTPHH